MFWLQIAITIMTSTANLGELKAMIKTNGVAVPHRIAALDKLRGVVIVLMILDHVRDFYFGYGTDPVDMNATWPLLFFTRWITHFCAPTFILLAGISAYFYGQKYGARQLQHFLVTRGLWLIFLELTVIRFAWSLNWHYDVLFLQVIWVLGCSMILLASMVNTSLSTLMLLGIVIIFGHNLLDNINIQSFSFMPWLWQVLHVSGTIETDSSVKIFLIYPLIPWVGVIFVGYCLGKFIQSKGCNHAFILYCGLGLCLLFIGIRLLNGYGNPAPWTAHEDWLLTIMSFLNTHKYPPSLSYLLMTLGPALILLYALSKMDDKTFKTTLIFGQVPMFIYIVHLYIGHISGYLLGYYRWGENMSSHYNGPEYPLWVSYIAWAIVCIIVFYLGRAYGQYKRTHSNFITRYV